jgi:type I restriction enzyme S subunit
VPDARDTVKAGDLLLSRANTRELVGAVVLVAKDHPHLMLSDKSLRLCYLPEIVPTFLLYALRTKPVRAVFEDDSTGNSLSMLNITQQQILSVPIPLAPLAKQQQLAAILSSAWSTANQTLDAARALSDDLTTTEHALLTAAFRGELVPSAAP